MYFYEGPNLIGFWLEPDTPISLEDRGESTIWDDKVCVAKVVTEEGTASGSRPACFWDPKTTIALEGLAKTRGGIEGSIEVEPVLATMTVLPTLEGRTVTAPLE